VALSSSGNIAIRYVLLILWITSCLPIIGQANAMPVGCLLKVTNQGQHRCSLMSVIGLLTVGARGRCLGVDSALWWTQSWWAALIYVPRS